MWALVECVSDGVSVGNQYYPLHSITSYSLLAGRDNGTYAGYYAVPGAQPPPVCNSGVCTYTANNTESLAKGTFPTRMAVQESIYAANATTGLGYNSLGSSLPANYTLVAGDEWGQLTILHFSVVASHNLPEVGSFLANGGGCAENNNPVPCTTSGFSQAFIFNCAAQAASTSGCTAQVPSSGPWSAKSLHHNGLVSVLREVWGTCGGQLHVQRAWRHGVSVRILLHGQLYGIRPESLRLGMQASLPDLVVSREKRIVIGISGAKSSIHDHSKVDFYYRAGIRWIEVTNETVRSAMAVKAICQALALSVGSSRPERVWSCEGS